MSLRPLHRFTVLPTVPEPLRPLVTLARNLRWTWHPPVQELFAAIDPDGWEASGHNPLRMLNEAPSEVLERAAGDQVLLAMQAAAAKDLERYLTEPRWYQTLHDAPRLIAYFSPEFGVSEVLPQYSGGLGVLAGDHLKAASDLGAPVVGVGLFYRSGYFRQSLSADGRQQESYPAFNPQELPLELVKAPGSDEPLRVSVRLPDATLWAQVWRADVGRCPLLLLDADVDDNAAAERAVTDRLYGGGGEHRLRQEILLGIGGVRVLEALGLEPEVFHTNEGHAGFLGLERVRRLVQEEGLDPGAAIEAVRAGTVFTTHTPVAAGIDRFPRALVARYFGAGGVETGLELERILALGAEPEGDGSLFNMAYMGLRLAQRANGVSRLHGEVSRELFHALWPAFPAEEVPIGHVTNGVHAGTWVDRDCAELFERVLGPDYGTAGGSWAKLAEVPDEELWEARRRARSRLVDDVRHRLAQAWRARGASERRLGWIARAFDPDVLTIGFARRVPSYKRLTLLLKDPERLRRLLLDPQRPIQLVIAGKAHPADEGGKALIAEFARFAADPAVRHRIAFLPDYDMAMARTLIAGSDVWLNNPLRPSEACGTSGMKAALNGSLNLSIRDGWWDELYDGENGWAIPSADDPSIAPARRDELEASAIYDLLEYEIVPLFYDQDPAGLPRGWLQMIRHDLVSLGPAVLASRMVRQYIQHLYQPAADSSRRLRAGRFAAARELAAWKQRVAAAWPAVRLRQVEDGQRDRALGSHLQVRATVELGELDPSEVAVQVVYGRVDDADQLRDTEIATLKQNGRLPDDPAWRFEGEIPLRTPGAFGYTVRIIPHHDALTSPAETGLITWAG
jgi:starch phosphorylase